MKLPNSYYNKISFFGTLIAGFSLSLILFLFIIIALSGESSPYLGLALYLITPGFLILGLVMIPIGMRIKVKRERKNKKEDITWKVINLNIPRTRNAMIVFVMGTFVILILSAIGSYKAFHFTESVEFCGTLCHQVMEPEYTAYQHSPHARVACVDCHVGEGADWYVKSKLSGLHQVYYATLKKYPRPIPTPIANLRPARETCEKCHWPNKFYANRLVHERSYLADSANTEWNITLKMKTGPSHRSQGLKEGIHWHINPNVKIEYISQDGNREVIPWVRYINLSTGDTLVYNDEMNTLEKSVIDSIAPRTMDCMDCHNRPSHLYKSPSTYVDNALSKGTVPKQLPYIKQAAMQVLYNTKFVTRDSAHMQIKDKIAGFYADKYPDVAVNKKVMIDQAINGIIEEFDKNAFPEMKVYHSTYTNHIGHQESFGCFRCHSGTHMNNGETIRNDCNLCHTIISQGPEYAMRSASVHDSLEFEHPDKETGEAWKEMACAECHSALY